MPQPMRHHAAKRTAGLAAAPSVTKLLVVELWLSAIYASYNSAMVVHLTEIVPEEAGASGFSLAYSLATAIGGFTPFVVTALIAATGNLAMPGIWLTALCERSIGQVQPGAFVGALARRPMKAASLEATHLRTQATGSLNSRVR